ncbi:unnamed protein product, partial [Symbiodinium pilosum]
AMGGFDHVRTGFMQLVQTFEEQQRILLQGNLARRLAMTDVPKPDTFEGERYLEAVDATWASLKPVLIDYVNEKAVYTFEDPTVAFLADVEGE